MEAIQKQYYKCCMVPLCPSTTFKTPDKLFIRVPRDKSRRLTWLKACRRAQTDISEKTTAHVCEDHFNLEEDMDNYVKFKLMGGLKKMKANVVPHIFDCQPDRKRSHTNHPRAAAVKRAKRRIVDESIASSAMTQEQVFNQDDLQIVASSSQTSTISIPPRQAARNASKAISASSFDKSMEKFNPDLSQREKRKLNKKFNQSTVRKPNGAVYDEKGRHVSGVDLCDCLNEKCPGCWFECPKCESNKCGTECRVFRKYIVDSIEYHGYDKTVRNNLALRS
ncbi:uncharacterized protein LOC109546422 isoform X1 [Dendroctonus ponderosae]|uniref:uncharacterized protein LOC109546422 isoform X1 n=1 Tax=Dendroctonus ponderosae TaxID=77166 RepID=UPI002035D948|nr:uncharacterized protein LOC109546422 isoform X1 [Dendroctonus ponderosae]